MAKSSKTKSSGNTQSSTSTSTDNSKICAILCYILIGVIWYFVDENMRRNSFVRYHAKQGLILIIASVVFNIIGSIPFLGWAIAWILQIIVLIWVIQGIVNAANNKTKPLFVIGPIAEKWNI